MFPFMLSFIKVYPSLNAQILAAFSIRFWSRICNLSCTSGYVTFNALIDKFEIHKMVRNPTNNHQKKMSFESKLGDCTAADETYIKCTVTCAKNKGMATVLRVVFPARALSY
jgi:hypothetical protein